MTEDDTPTHYKRDNMFNFGWSETTGENYCDLFDHGIYRIFRDDVGDIVQIILIRDGKYIELSKDWDGKTQDE